MCPEILNVCLKNSRLSLTCLKISNPRLGLTCLEISNPKFSYLLEFSAGVLKKRNVVVVGEHCVSHQAKVVKMATVQESADEEDDEVIEQPDADN